MATDKAAEYLVKAMARFWEDMPAHEFEHRFSTKRLFRFDIAFPSERIAIEIEGGIWSRGRHSRPSGMLKDMDKYNLAAELGWRVFRYDTGKVTKDPLSIVEQIKGAIGNG